MNRIPLGQAVGVGGTVKTGPFGTVLKADEYSDVGVPMVSVREIRDGFFEIDALTPRLGPSTTARLPEYLLEAGDVVFARKGGVERSAYVSHDEAGWFLGSDGIRVRPGRSLHGRFLAFQVRSLRAQNWLLAHATGSTMASLSQGVVSRLPIWVPPMTEQRAIAEVLGALDDKIAANAQIAGTSEALMVNLVDGLFRDSPLADVADLGKDQVSAKELAGAAHWNHYSLPAFDNARLPSREAGPTILSNKFRLVGPSVLWSKLNPRIPRVWNVPSPSPNAIASTEFLVLTPKTIPSAALWAVLASTASSSFLQERAAGTSGSHQRVRPADALQMPMPGAQQFPPQLLDQLASLGEVVQAVRQESHTLAELRDTLLPALMDGTIRVQDAVATAEEVL